MNHDFPNDADGDGLRRIVAAGSDLTKPIRVDFKVALADETAAKRLGDAASKLGYKVAIYASPGCTLPWTCECSTRMLATHQAIVSIQTELAALAAPFGGHLDGWGTLGNKP